jgi:hypothetical protein
MNERDMKDMFSCYAFWCSPDGVVLVQVVPVLKISWKGPTT